MITLICKFESESSIQKMMKKTQPYSDALVTYYRNVGSWNWPKELHKWSKPFCFINLNMYLYKILLLQMGKNLESFMLIPCLKKQKSSKQTNENIN